MQYPVCAVCNSEREAAKFLGYTAKSWDNLSGKEVQPPADDKWWVHLTENEQAAAAVLGWTEKSWDFWETEPQPASANKSWAELTKCRDGKHASVRLNLNLLHFGTCYWKTYFILYAESHTHTHTHTISQMRSHTHTHDLCDALYWDKCHLRVDSPRGPSDYA